MEMWIIWLIIMGVMLLIELCSQMIWALCLAVGCIGGVISALTGLPFYWQVIIMAIFSLFAYSLFVTVFQKWLYRRNDSRPGKHTRTGMEALLGRRAIISEEAKPGHLGRARIDGDNWQVKCPGNQSELARGTEVVVTGYDSIILEVEPLK